MDGYQKSSHAVYRCEYHFVWIPKYRYQVLVQEIKSRLKEILVELCEYSEGMSPVRPLTELKSERNMNAGT